MRIPAGPCAAGDELLVYEQVPFRKTTIGRAPCAPDLLIAGFQPGAYRLLLTMIKDDAAERETASIPFVVKDENVEIMAPLERGVTVNVTAAAAEGAKAIDFSKLRVSFHPLDALPIGEIVMDKEMDASGRARFVGIPLGDQDVLVTGIAHGNYVKEIRYNGHPVVGRTVPLGGAMAQEVTILVDDKPAAVTGAVMAGDKPVSDALVALARWPLPGATYHADTRFLASTDRTGRFQFIDLAPGEYRVVAVRSRGEFEERMPGTLERELAAAKKIEVGPNVIQNATIELSTLR